MSTVRTTILLVFFPLLLSAQHTELGIMLGFSNYIGDLSNNSNNIYLNETRPAVGLLARYNLNDYLAFRLGGAYTRLSGRDANVSNDEFIRQRNLSFRSSLMELSLTAEVNLPGYQPYGLFKPFSPYLFAGVSVARFNPQTRYQGDWVDLQPLGTEGQGLPQYPERGAPYKLNTFSIPFGLGIKYALSDKINIGLEIGARRAFTDYLDDVSTTYVSYEELLSGRGELAAALGNRTGELAGAEPVSVETGTRRGDNNANDWFFILGATVSYNFLENGLMGSRQRQRKRAGCY
ncbi:MAG: hypothetical protein RI973_1698 [Bacteroidota bacterium]|jgi:hypothetical protein